MVVAGVNVGDVSRGASETTIRPSRAEGVPSAWPWSSSDRRSPGPDSPDAGYRCHAAAADGVGLNTGLMTRPPSVSYRSFVCVP